MMVALHLIKPRLRHIFVILTVKDLCTFFESTGCVVLLSSATVAPNLLAVKSLCHVLYRMSERICIIN